MPMHEASDVTQYVQDFPPDGDEQELRDQLDGCRAVILRSACVQLELRPNRKNFAKPNFVTLLVEYWKDSVAISSHASITPRAVHVPEPNVTPRNAREEMVDAKQKRTREEEKTPKKKKAKVMERSGDLFEEKVGAMAASLEKAKVVKEWASAIEILSRVDGSAESIALFPSPGFIPFIIYKPIQPQRKQKLLAGDVSLTRQENVATSAIRTENYVRAATATAGEERMMRDNDGNSIRLLLKMNSRKSGLYKQRYLKM
ncbi:hypothetical protein PPTG_20105 [Phytophthora nicotianae INRA-310]|uniref:Uncharacterized protein n=1 Tax=Phytophthora nicotianae (strain INRA-310) TaxID=761204 RepID=W2PBQ7_PHYN3|nr:hypothetical protein PPTG_20105 [Phytophthora nicotianae INRA-310]ETM97663.1 hypothetical protein PPTG_20105 [Phytophthora nicotianae INRA-310]